MAKKVCPLLKDNCREKACAWWYADYNQCAVLDLAKSHESIRLKTPGREEPRG